MPKRIRARDIPCPKCEHVGMETASLSINKKYDKGIGGVLRCPKCRDKSDSVFVSGTPEGEEKWTDCWNAWIKKAYRNLRDR